MCTAIKTLVRETKNTLISSSLTQDKLGLMTGWGCVPTRSEGVLKASPYGIDSEAGKAAFGKGSPPRPGCVWTSSSSSNIVLARRQTPSLHLRKIKSGIPVPFRLLVAVPIPPFDYASIRSAQGWMSVTARLERIPVDLPQCWHGCLSSATHVPATEPLDIDITSISGVGKSRNPTETHWTKETFNSTTNSNYITSS